MLAATQASALEIRLLGDPEVLVGGRTQALPASKKTRALLGYLIATGRPQRRERLCELLWDGPDDPRAGLRWSLAKLRPLIDAGRSRRIVADRERVGFEPHGALVDLLVIRALRDQGLVSASTPELSAAAGRFRGPFLEGLELASCPAFHAWCVAEREALRALHVDVLMALIERLRSEPARALGHARALVALDPLAESPRLLLMDLLAAMGDTRRVLEEYDEYAGTLRRELGIQPSAQLELRRSAVRRTSGARASGAALEVRGSARAGDADGAARTTERSLEGSGPASERSPSASVPFVGRERERRELEQRLDRAGRGAPALLVLGEPGIGKTRLLEELARLTRERGGRALSGRAFEAELVRPYGAFIDALRAASGRGARSDPAVATLPAAFTSHVADRTRLYAAILDELRALARQCAPLVLLLDDLHWFDEASAELFHYLARALAPAPVLLAASARAGELADNAAAQRLVRALGRERLATSIELGPLPEAELRSLLCNAGAGPAPERVILEAAGNPLFALEAARAIDDGAGDLVGSLSTLIADRLGRLHESDRSLLSWAGALGRSFDVSVLARVTGLAVPELLESLERLERHAILRSRESGYDFAHDLVRQAAYRQMSSPRRRLVHAQIARALSAAPDPDGALASDVAHHAALAGDGALAARACISAGHRCLRLFALREAHELAHRGSRFVTSLPDAERVALALELLAIEILAGTRGERGASLSELAAEARCLGLPSAEARAHFLKSVLYFRADESTAAFESSLARIEATRHSGPEELGAELAGAARCCLMLERNTDAAVEFLARAQAMLGAGSDDLELVWAQALLASQRGELDSAAEQLQRALQLARRQHQHWEECECLLELAWVDLDRGRTQAVLAHGAELADVALRLGDGAYAPVAECVRALVPLAHERREGGARGADAREDGARGSGAPELDGRSGALEQVSGTALFEAFDARWPALGAAGANRLLAAVLGRAAELALRAGALERAEQYATEALAAARRVQRSSEMIVARVALAQVAVRRGDAPLARGTLDELSSLAGGADVSARAARALASLRDALEPHAADAPSSAGVQPGQAQGTAGPPDSRAPEARA